MSLLLQVLLLCHVAIVASRLIILPNDADEEWCASVNCAESEMCVMDTDVNVVKCLAPTELSKLLQKQVSDPRHQTAGHQQHRRQESSHTENHCTRSELMRMGGRLVKWFSDVHSKEAGVDHSLKIHSVACRADVGWMFNQWDGNNDGLLSMNELRPLERGGNEPCVKEFIDMCDDMVVDGAISIDEWCDCFSFSDDLRHEPPCHKAKHNVDPHLLGVFLPRCDMEGFYKSEQCHEGHCWCVDRYGREFDKSRVQNSLPDCGQYASDLTEKDIAFLKARM
uniref:Thyroglobulin type-1 domain-containing protein n=1 Tax=Caenorhabditis japonica TaxID=281687 RepID=H2W354_CAEJA